MRTRTRVLVAALVVAGLLVAAASALSFIQGLTTNSTAPLSVNGTVATVSGTVQCEPGVQTFVDVRLRQAKGPTFTEAFGFTEITCDGTVQSWSVLVTTPQGAVWKAGKATVNAFTEDADNEVLIQNTIRLTKG